MVWPIVVLVLIVLIVLWVLRKRRRRNKAIQIVLHHSQRLSDQVMDAALTSLKIPVQEPLTSKPITDIWGHGVMAFSYIFPKSFSTIDQHQLADALQKAAEELDIASSDPALPPFVITDYFELEGQQHVDLAFIANEATIEYVRDVNRVA
ncbi:hypothetical protein [Lacticaseibacillus paracasei]|uniref:hypothetical protein n=1 Tax=Lacticaseibacillus paracasei TaxID=1597 RepID=UPI0015F85799|nr:hypothetical protein [Lacticaseibacillus paracasei]MBB1166946.1 hypothetical protein [Lacticaseibacillus paracasei]